MTRALVLRFFFSIAVLHWAVPQMGFAEQSGSSWDYSYSDSSGSMDSSWNDPASSGSYGWDSAGTMGSPADTSMWDYSTMSDYSMGWNDPATAGSGGMMDDPAAWDSSASADYSMTADDWESWSDPALSDHSATADTSTPSAYATPSEYMTPPDYATPSAYATPSEYPTAMVDPVQTSTTPSVYSTPAPSPSQSPTAMIDPVQSPTPPKYGTPSPSPTQYPTATPTPIATPTPAPTPSASPSPAPTAMPTSAPTPEETPIDYPPLYPPVGSPEPEPFDPIGFCGDGICKDFELGSCSVDCGPQGETPQAETPSCPGQLEAAPPAECNLVRADLIEPFDFHRQSDPASALWHSSEAASGAPSPHGNEMVPLFQIDGAPLTIQHKFLLPPASYQYQRNSYLLATAVEVAQDVETQVELIWLDAQGLELERWSAGTDAFAGLHSYRENLIAPCNAQSALLLITATPAPDAPPALLRVNRARFEYLSCSAGDPDDDKLFGEYDNCPLRRNVDQRDRNTDGIGDACSQVALSVEELEAELAALPPLPEAGSQPQSQPGDGGSSGSETGGGSSNAPLDPSTPLFRWELFPVQTEDDEIVGSCGMHNVCNNNDRCCLAIKSQLAFEELTENRIDHPQRPETLENTERECPWPDGFGRIFDVKLPQDSSRYDDFLKGTVLIAKINSHSTGGIHYLEDSSGQKTKEFIVLDPCHHIAKEYALEFVRKDGDVAIFERPERDGGPYIRAKLQLSECTFGKIYGNAPVSAHCPGEFELISHKHRVAVRHRSAVLTNTDIATFRIYVRHHLPEAGNLMSITEPIPELGFQGCTNFYLSTSLDTAGVIPDDMEQRKIRVVLDTHVSEAVTRLDREDVRPYMGTETPYGTLKYYLEDMPGYGEQCEGIYSGKEFILSLKTSGTQTVDGLRLSGNAMYEYLDPNTGAKVTAHITDRDNAKISLSFGGYFNFETDIKSHDLTWNSPQFFGPSPQKSSKVFRHSTTYNHYYECLGTLRTVEWQ